VVEIDLRAIPRVWGLRPKQQGRGLMTGCWSSRDETQIPSAPQKNSSRKKGNLPPMAEAQDQHPNFQLQKAGPRSRRALERILRAQEGNTVLERLE
jgi:hypothetical protein